ncbi:penicillin-binding protein 2, partial [Paraburkholderia sp. SIMBA_049]
LAVSLETFEIWANPKILDAAAWSPLAKLLDMPLAELRRRLAGDRSFVLLKRQVDADTAAHIDEMATGGITLIADSKR